MQFRLSTILSALSLTFSSSEVVPNNGLKQVAIIGAGPGGSATAYYLQQYAEREGFEVNITVFEKTDRIGGRTLTVNAYDDSTEPIELGASIFIEDNRILFNATRNFGLGIQDPDSASHELLGIWDGDKFVYTQDSGSWDWWNLAKLFWKYGMAPYKAQNLVKSTIATFLKLYDSPVFPFRSLTQRAFELGLVDITSIPGSEFLSMNGISDLFAHDIIQAATRVNYASNLAYIHGLETMVSMAPEGSMQVEGGNWRIFDSMINRSNATVHRNSPVSSISLQNRTESDASAAKYLISTKQSQDNSGTKDQELSTDRHLPAFDNVVIATPWQYADIKTGENVLQEPIDEIPYTKLHVTLFCSPFLLSPEYFNLKSGSKAPDAILTTLGPNDKPKPGADGAGVAGFYSISTLRTITNPVTLKEEYVYKIFSPSKVTAEFLSELLGTQVPETFVPPDRERDDDENATVDPISWYYPHVFHSYPILYPRVTFQDPVVGDGLYYVSGMESFISTMETSALMGMNVARLIANDFAADLAAKEEHKEASQGTEEDGSPAQEFMEGDEKIIPDEL